MPRVSPAGVFARGQETFSRHGRRAHFGSLDEALKAVRGWHAEELATVYCAGCLLPTRVEGDCMCHL